MNIAAQSLDSALIELSRQSGIEVLMSSDTVKGLQTAGAQGTMPLAEALSRLLKGTSLSYRAAGARTISIQAAGEGASSADGALLQDSPLTLADAAGEHASSEAADAGSGINATGQSTTTSVQASRRDGIEEIIVTGQKRAERIQDVPIAISAFSMDQLDNQKIEGGFDLLKAVPNVTFSKNNFSGYNFQIRGIGTQAVSATTDPGVAVSFNNTTLIVNRLFEQEYLDIERVEVLRGPQGTLYGRNATAGVINVISAKPKLGVHEGEIKMEAGNYGSQRLRTHYNLPLGDTWALRGAFASTVRDGYGYNEFDGSDIDDRDLWTGRLTLGWEPNERLRANLLWERFRENDQRVRSIKQLCHRDEGLTSIQGYNIMNRTEIQFDTQLPVHDIFQDQLTQGCVGGSLYDEGAFGVPNGLALPFVAVGRVGLKAAGLGYNPYNTQRPTPREAAPCEPYKTAFYVGLVNLCNEDPFAGATQSRDLRRVHSEIKPIYQARSDVFELSLDFDVNDQMLLSSQTVYVRDSVRSTQDLNRFRTLPGFFNDSLKACGTQGSVDLCQPGTFASGLLSNLTPGGVLCDPQLGCSDRFRAMDLSRSDSTQFNQEVRLVTSFDGPWNYSLGANFTRFTTLNDYFVFSNTLTGLSQLSPFRGLGGFAGMIPLCRPNAVWLVGEEISCVYTDTQSLNQLLDGATPEGHNYFLSRNPYELNSMALFGETYWNATDTFKVTAGLRVTWDQKTFTPVPSQTLLMDFRQGFSRYEDPAQCGGISLADFCARMGTGVGGRGYPSEPDIVQEWLEPTGRLGFDWKPDLQISWLDESLIYAFYTRGYKAGGANPPGVASPAGAFLEKSQGAVAPRVFKAEYVNALEIGTKNRLFGGGMTVNANAFYYDYENYQVSKIVNRAAANENFDAKVWGAELELMLAPTNGTLLNASLGYLRTRIADGEQSIDLMDRTQGGGEMFITSQENPNFDPTLTPRDRADYQAGVNAPADQQFLAFDEWVVIKPSLLQTSNCIAPADLVRAAIEFGTTVAGELSRFCPGGTIEAYSYLMDPVPGTNGTYFDPMRDAPNGTAGFFAELGGKQLPNAPRYTVSLGGQQTIYLPGGWDLTGRVDWYWQDKSYARVYNTTYDQLKAWTNTSFSVWVAQPAWGLRIEAYVKNAFDETPITGAYLGSDDTGLTTNVFTLDPRLVGVSITKSF